MKELICLVSSSDGAVPPCCRVSVQTVGGEFMIFLSRRVVASGSCLKCATIFLPLPWLRHCAVLRDASSFMRLLVLKLAKLVQFFIITALHMEYVSAFMAGLLKVKYCQIADMLASKGQHGDCVAFQSSE